MEGSSSAGPSATLLDNPDNRFARYTSQNHSAPIWIASILSLIFAYIILAVRLGFVKWNMHGLDDLLLTLAYLVGLGMWIALFISLNNGLGKALNILSGDEIAEMNQSFSASRILLFLALTLSKCSVLVFIQKIFDYVGSVLLAANITMGIVTAWGLAAAVTMSAGCSPDHIVVAENVHCHNDVLRLRAVTIVDVITEIAIILLPVVPLFHLRMPRKSKVLVIVAFSSRTPNLITSIMHLKTYSNFIHNGHRGVAIATPLVWQNALLSYNFMSATIPALKGFMRGFTTGGMGYTANSLGTGAGSSGNKSGGSKNSGTNSYKLQSLSSKAKSKSKAKPKAKVDEIDEVALVPEDYPDSAAEVTSVPRAPRMVRRTSKGPRDENSNQESRSIASHDSRKILIQKDWDISREQ